MKFLTLILSFFILFSCTKLKDFNKKQVKASKNSRTKLGETMKNINHLKKETSPYLLQHKDNPVHWYAWKKEAFERAEKENKPIFLSIGYSTCHWCHVMEHESFEDQEVADLLNEKFISIKVDREERPDVDEFYMDVAQKMTGRGGWPLTIIMTPDKKPFFAGTYFPKISFMSLLNNIDSEWNNNNDKIMALTQRVMEAVDKETKEVEANSLSKDLINSAVNIFKVHHDPVHFGMKSAPKFPSAHQWKFLLKYAQKANDETALNIALNTLKAMRFGGIYDQIGYGISRYSTDVKWLVPHFEKMLYDQAVYIIALTEAYAITKDDIYKNIIEEIYIYLNRVMKDEGGAFYSAEDADSEGVEGKYYVWTKKELEEILNDDEKWVIDYYGVSEDGNFEGENILFIDPSVGAVHEQPLRREQTLQAINEKLLKIRDKRIKPHKDTKILVHWNAMLANALANAGNILNEEKYIQSSKNIIDFILKNMRNEKNELIRSYKTEIKGFLTDYSYFSMALFSYYQASFDAKYLKESIFYADMMVDKFWDETRFVTVEKSASDLPSKTESSYDGAMPSGQAIAISLMQKLSVINSKKYKQYLETGLNHVLSDAKNYPIGYSRSLDTLDDFYSDFKEVVITGSLKNKDTQDLLSALKTDYYPYKIVILHQDLAAKADKEAIEELIPFTKEQISLNGKATAYVCEEGMCKKPTSDKNEMLKYLRN